MNAVNEVNDDELTLEQEAQMFQDEPDAGDWELEGEDADDDDVE